MPYNNLPEADWPKMDRCVRDVMAKDPNLTEQRAIAICYNSVTGKSMDKAVTQTTNKKDKGLDIAFDFPIFVQKKYVEKDQYGNEKWYLEGYAATDDFDLQGDIISPEALKKAETHLLENSTVLFNHHDDEPIGRVIESHFDQKGLFLKMLISKTVPDTWQKIKEGVLNKFSISAKVLKAAKKFIKELGLVANVIEELLLLEVSLVSVPANPKAKAIRWYVSKALREFEKEGGEIKVDKQSFEVVEKTDELTLEKSLDPSPNLAAASADENIETKDEDTTKKSTVVTKTADELGEEATDGSKAPATDKPVEGETKVETPKVETMETPKTEEATGETAEAKADATEGEAPADKTADAEPTLEKSATAPQPPANEGVKPRTGHQANANPSPKTGVDVNTNPSPKVGVKKNMDAVRAMLTDLVGYLDSPDADPAIPAEVKDHCKAALSALTPAKSADVESETIKALKLQVETLTKSVQLLQKNQTVTRKGLVREEEQGGDSKVEAVKKAGNPEDRLKKAIEVGMI